MPKLDQNPVHIIGGGLAGSEAAWQLLKRNIPVIMQEMRPTQKTFAHVTENLAELVCSNSFRSDDHFENAVGLLHYELRALDSIIMKAADAHQVPAGSALAVDREGFSGFIQDILMKHPLFTLERKEIEDLESIHNEHVIVATGPLTSNALSESIKKLTGHDHLAFFDAIAPIIFKDSINFDIAWFQSRYDKTGPGGNGADYINCPMNQQQYENFVQALINGDKTEFKEWEKNTPYFEGCLPIEVMAERGVETLRFGPMKPVGLTNPHSSERPYAVVQLRQDNSLGTIYNLVGFQTKLKYGAQKEIIQMIPGLEQAEFARLGGIHRNSFIKSPVLLDETLRLKNKPNLRFAGQITGVEGYVESTSIGLLSALFITNERAQKETILPPSTTALGGLLYHITKAANRDTFQPMNINFGLLPELAQRTKKINRKKMYTERAKADFELWHKTTLL